MYITLEDLLQFCGLLIAVVSLVVNVYKNKKR